MQLNAAFRKGSKRERLAQTPEAVGKGRKA